MEKTSTIYGAIKKTDIKMRRNINYDFLRVAAAFTVVCLHISAQFATNTPDLHSVNWWIANIADSLSRWCVPIFVMLSGALLLSPEKEQTPQAKKDFYKNRLSRLLIPLIFWTILYICFRAGTEQKFTLTTALTETINGNPYFHLWYIYMALGLYIITPYLRVLIRHIDRQSLLSLTIFSLTISSIEVSFGSGSVLFISKFIPYIGYFLAGYYLSTTNRKYSLPKLTAISISSGLLISILTAYYFEQIGNKVFSLMYGYLNPLVIVMSCCVFIVALRTDINNGIVEKISINIAPLSLGIYLIHPLWLWVLNRYIFWRFGNALWIEIPIFTMLVFTLSAASSLIITKIPIAHRTI